MTYRKRSSLQHVSRELQFNTQTEALSLKDVAAAMRRWASQQPVTSLLFAAALLLAVFGLLIPLGLEALVELALLRQQANLAHVPAPEEGQAVLAVHRQFSFFVEGYVIPGISLLSLLGAFAGVLFCSREAVSRIARNRAT